MNRFRKYNIDLQETAQAMIDGGYDIEFVESAIANMHDEDMADEPDVEQIWEDQQIEQNIEDSYIDD